MANTNIDIARCQDIMNILLCSRRTAFRRASRIRELLNIPKGTKLTKQQVLQYKEMCLV